VDCPHPANLVEALECAIPMRWSDGGVVFSDVQCAKAGYVNRHRAFICTARYYNRKTDVVRTYKFTILSWGLVTKSEYTSSTH
jgi:hypothetical protein